MKTRLRPFSAALAAVLLASLAFAQTPPATAPAQVPANKEFDFWFGDWEVTGADGAVIGWSRIIAQPGGRVLHEVWNDARGGGGNGWIAHDAGSGQWRYVYADRAGAFAELSGRAENGRLLLAGTGKPPTKDKRHLRIAWEARPDGTVRQIMEQSFDGAKWEGAFDGVYRKLNDGQKLFVVVRQRGAGWVAGKQLLDQPDYAGHIAFVRKNFRPGAIRHIGQLGAEGTHFQYIVRATDAAAARRLIGEDPWDAAKIVEIESVRAYTPFFGIP